MSNLIPSFNRLFKGHHHADLGYFKRNNLTHCIKNSLSNILQTGLLTFVFSVFVTISLLPFSNAYADESVGLCLPEWISEPIAVTPEASVGGNVSPTVLEADELSQPNSNLYEFNGAVIIDQPGTVMRADNIQYQKETEQVNAFGHVELHRNDLIIQAEEAQLNNKEQTAELLETRYQMKPSRAHGTAKRIAVDQERNIAQLEHATFTTCPIQKLVRQVQTDGNEMTTVTDEKVAWELSFGQVEINQQSRRMIGKNTVLKFHNLPIFYSPYFDFPLDNRASGLLFPEFGGYKSLTDDQSRFFYKQPYYFNLAPNYDDTLTAIYLENRGLILENEFRYLEKIGPVTHRGAFTLTGLNDSETAENGLAFIDGDSVVYGETIEQRWRAKLIADQVWAPGLTSSILWHETSDENFFADIPIEEQYKTVSNLQRYVRADYRQTNWNAYAQFLGYLPLRDAATNYEKRPEIGINYNQSFKQTYGELRFDVAAEATEFDIPVSDSTKPEALRSRLAPELSYAIRKSYGYLKANVIANTLNYGIRSNANSGAETDSITNTIMQYALRGGLTFERNLNLLGHRYIQTLEPELQYLLVPYVNQSNVPLFDTSSKSLDFSNLFAFNRFSGYDRIGDTKQVTTALTSKLLTEQGKPLLEAGIGQILYLQDREVTLNNTDPIITEQSDYFVKLGITADNVYFSSTSQYSQEDKALINANSRLRWNASKNTKLLLNHILTNNNLPAEKDTLALGATFKINNNWQAGTYWNYDFTNNIRNEMVNAIRYDDCCWAGELSVEETQLENGLYNYSFQISIELKGLSSSGKSFQNYLDSKLNF